MGAPQEPWELRQAEFKGNPPWVSPTFSNRIKLARRNQAESNQIQPNPNKSDQIQPNPTKSNLPRNGVASGEISDGGLRRRDTDGSGRSAFAALRPAKDDRAPQNSLRIGVRLRQYGMALSNWGGML